MGNVRERGLTVNARKSAGASHRTGYALVSFLLHLPLLVFLSAPYRFSGWDLQLGARVAIIISILLYLHVSFLYKERFWSVPSLTFLVLSLFHIGLFASPAWSGTTPEIVIEAGSRGLWFRSPEVQLALNYALIGLVMYSAGLTLSVFLWQRRAHTVSSISRLDADDQIRERFSVFGLYLMAFSIFLWFALSIQHAGISFLFLDYREYLAISGQISGMNYTYVGISYGVVFAFFTKNRRRLGLVIATFAIYIFASLLIGMRDNALIPAVCAAVVWAKLNGKHKTLPLFLGVVVVLSIMNLVKEIRSGFSEINLSESSFSPLSAIEEMGSSLRVLYTTVIWHDLNGEPLRAGITYLGPFLRALDPILGGREGAGGLDYRIMGQEISHRAGAIGGSMIAEAHHNFGIIGIVLVLFIFGVAMGFFTLNATRPIGIAVLGVLTTLFLMHVRNSFTPIPFWLFIGIVLIILVVKYPGTQKGLNRTRAQKVQKASVATEAGT